MCTKPLTAWQLLPRHWDDLDHPPQPVFKSPQDLNRYEKLSLSCTKCISCLKVHAMSRAVQLGCELQTTLGDSQFLTLTYDNDHLSPGWTLDAEHPRLFMKRLRKWLNKYYPGTKIRYWLVGEYGEKSFRPHYHFAIYNLPVFDDQVLSNMRQPEDYQLFESETLTKIWGKGNVIINLLTPPACLYIAQHSDKKINRKIDYFEPLVIIDTGEIIEPPLLRFNKKDKQNRLVLDKSGKPETELRRQRLPEFTSGSSKPGLGTEWFKRFGKTDLHQGILISLDKQAHKIPRHIMNLINQDIPDLYQKLKAEAKAYAIEHQRTPDQLEYQNKFDHESLKYKTPRNKL